jgi:glycosyltransferase involved in cell wall biosynthesis
MQFLSVIIPARDEEGCIASTVEHLHLELDLRGVPHEIIVVDDGSTDRTWPILQEEAARLNGVPRKMEDRSSEVGNSRAEGAVTQVCYGLSPSAAADSGSGLKSPPSEPLHAPSSMLPASPTRHTSHATSHKILHCVQNPGPHGFGRAITCGLDTMKGDAAVIMMADESDDCRDVVRYWEKLNEGYDCVFGSRFMKGGGTIDYPPIKLFMNRVANAFVRLLFRHGLNDTTNAFKAYRKEVIDGIRPILSPHFNITVELPLKAIVRGYNFAVIPITWRNRRHGVAKLKIKEMGSRYLFIVLYVWLEKYFSRGDYKKA